MKRYIRFQNAPSKVCLVLGLDLAELLCFYVESVLDELVKNRPSLVLAEVPQQLQALRPQIEAGLVVPAPFAKAR